MQQFAVALLLMCSLDLLVEWVQRDFWDQEHELLNALVYPKLQALDCPVRRPIVGDSAEQNWCLLARHLLLRRLPDAHNMLPQLLDWPARI